MRSLLLYVFSFVLFVNCSTLQGDKNSPKTILHFENDDLKSLVTEGKKIQERLKISNQDILIIYDIDNTLLHMKQNFGSDQWWTWQSKNCLSISITQPPKKFCAANNIDKLLKIQKTLLTIYPMQLTQNDIPQLINTTPYAHLILTSRGPDFFDLTRMELNRNNIDISDKTLIKKTDRLVKIQDKREALFYQGLYLTAGLNKGEMLLKLLEKFNLKNYKLILFADDHQHNIDNMKNALQEKFHLITLRFSKIDEKVQHYQKNYFQQFEKNEIKYLENIKQLEHAF
jgi:hypothetical protein